MNIADELLSPGPITASLVVSASGSHVDKGGTSKNIGGPADLELLKAFRQRANWVLTTGLTARVESYLLPRHARLAVLTRSGEQGLPATLDPEEVLVLGSSTPLEPYEAVEHLAATPDTRIHIEFGPTTLIPLIKTSNQIELFVSSEHQEGIAAFCESNDLVINHKYLLPNLFVSRVAGRA